MAQTHPVTSSIDERSCACRRISNGNREVDISDNDNPGPESTESPYILPKDAKESARLEEQARLLCGVMKHNIIHSKVPNGEMNKVLDVGCGTGFATDSIALKFPKANVYGVDLQPVREVDRVRPDNVHFLVGNILDEDVLDATNFDLIFSRLLLCGMTDWPSYITTMFRRLRPGGWIELHEIDWAWYKTGTDAPISDSWEWFQHMRTAAVDRDLDPMCGSKAASRLEATGFEHISVQEYYWPFGGDWEKGAEMKALGDYVPSTMTKLGDNTLPLLLRAAGIGEDDIGRMRAEMHKNLAGEAGKHFKFYVTIGRKPTLASMA